jgi:hypothetical protein
MKLCQVIAIANGKKKALTASVTELYKRLQRTEAFNGLTRVYSPLDDEGEELPTESKKVQHTVPETIAEARELWVDLLDVIATQEYANCKAKADIVVEGVTVLEEVPVTYMLFLEKRLDDIKSFVTKMPTLSTDVTWVQSASDETIHVADLGRTTRTKKVPKVFLKAEATEHHPAQTEMIMEDVLVGYWAKADTSGAISMNEKRSLLKRVDSLREGVKMAREEANSTEIDTVETGEAIMDFVFGA